MVSEINDITARTLSKELRDLEMNQLVIRTVHSAIPVTVKYSLSEYGKTIDNVIGELYAWGVQHRKRIIKKPYNVYPATIVNAGNYRPFIYSQNTLHYTI